MTTLRDRRDDPADPDERRRLSRRSFLGGGVAGLAAGALAGGLGGAAIAHARADEDAPADVSETAVPFYDQTHQGGIATPPQRYVVFASYDLTTTDAGDLQVLLARWSASIAQLQAGRNLGTVEPSRPSGVPTDTGEAADLGPNALTVTLGLGPGVFDDRFGLARHRPARFDHLPELPSDRLDPKLTGGDLSLQACAEDPQVAYHAIRDLSRLARGTAVVRWTVMGFGRASAGKGQTTPRNLMGFKDGTRNIKTDADLDQFVWHDGTDQAWMQGGTYQVARKIQMNIENWDADQIGDQHAVFGRTKQEGAPLSGTQEFDTPDFARKDASGELVIPATSHVALAAHENNGGLKILRRSYNFTDGMDEYGQINAGLLFIAYMNDPAAFVTMQTKLGRSDRLNEYISHVGSGVFAVPPAPATGHYVAEPLFG
ncbi:iron uptake transporter deferrochelatase/peroxidase subunit [Luteimicrobium subarcticum]|uniref:Deferrochelatase n=1 Tax=Luteimicrobium subarcticum TaxID=620910 RepID=A0A2M8WUT2_9MICO|nr:iron uptake transporter deferrochelatase/peroxidase subunit [Luteimicrobium subarcticum]PJI94707.1 deferrochelatase/peroxidase EfeB [Luteimicrobium subarcticum]